MSARRRACRALAAAALATLAACAADARAPADPPVPRPPASSDPRTAVLEGTITYLPRVALSPQAVVKVWLQDLSEPGSPVPVIIDEQVIRRPGQVPVAFRVRYAPQSIRSERRYALLVHIVEGDRIRFVNARRFHVLTQGGCTAACEVLVDLMN